MIVYDEYGHKSYFFFSDELSDKEKQRILEEDYEQEIEAEKQRFIELDGIDEYLYFNEGAA